MSLTGEPRRPSRLPRVTGSVSRWLGGFLSVAALAASAAEAPPAVPGSEKFQYVIVEKVEWNRRFDVVVERRGTGATQYLRRNYDCDDHTVGNLGEAASYRELKQLAAAPARRGVRANSIEQELWTEVCFNRLTEEQKQLAARMAEMDRIGDLEDRAQVLRPVRRDYPARGANITDSEVRQIQAVVTQLMPGTIVNIGAVVPGCPCEDGPMCTDQVWIVANRPGKSTGRLLSRISNQWQVGPVQQWWLEYEAMQARNERLTVDEENRLYEKFPRCLIEEQTQ